PSGQTGTRQQATPSRSSSSQQEHSPNQRRYLPCYYVRSTLGGNWESRKSLWDVPPKSSEPGKKCQDREGGKISSHGFPPARLPKLARSIHQAP
ncbi:hypothetical protein CSPX01_04132, partial [Colletotrichum filicis]